eukprot:scaffold129141_cov63-Phaeocystis_antarctica.AAC.3
MARNVLVWGCTAPKACARSLAAAVASPCTNCRRKASKASRRGSIAPPWVGDADRQPSVIRSGGGHLNDADFSLAL